MSKGFGKIERELVRILDAADVPIDTFSLTAAVYELPANEASVVVVPDAKLVSVRRGLRSLQKAGRAFYIARGYDKRGRWANEYVGLFWRIKLGQRRSMEIGADRDALMAHAAKLIPLIKRANELGIETSRESFVRPATAATRPE